MQEVRGDEQKPHSQGPGMRGELAHGSEAHRYAACGKCGACAPTVRVLTWGDLHRERCAWMAAYLDSEAPNDAAQVVSWCTHDVLWRLTLNWAEHFCFAELVYAEPQFGLPAFELPIVEHPPTPWSGRWPCRYGWPQFPSVNTLGRAASFWFTTSVIRWKWGAGGGRLPDPILPCSAELRRPRGTRSSGPC